MGRPLVFAIEDFHAPMSMTWSRSGLPTYLYGYDHRPRRERDGSLTVIPEKVMVHRWGSKEIPSGFFMLPGAENVSAVVFSNSATIARFNRMGVIAGFGSRRVRMVRTGVAFDHDPRASVPKRFERVVDDTYTESWIEGMDVYHNPRAKHPLDRAMLEGAAQHRLLPDGRIESVLPEWQPLGSITSITMTDADSGSS